MSSVDVILYPRLLCEGRGAGWWEMLTCLKPSYFSEVKAGEGQHQVDGAERWPVLCFWRGVACKRGRFLVPSFVLLPSFCRTVRPSRLAPRLSLPTSSVVEVPKN